MRGFGVYLTHNQIKFPTAVEGDPKAPFSIASTKW